MNALNELRDEIHANACAHGWWDEERSFGEIIALCHSELSEALEEYRDGKPNVWYANGFKCGKCDNLKPDGLSYCPSTKCLYGYKPEGIAIELADTIIRILDYCGHAGIDIDEAIRIKHEYNKTRSFRHGGKVI